MQRKVLTISRHCTYNPLSMAGKMKRQSERLKKEQAKKDGKPPCRDGLKFRDLGESIIQSLPIAVVAFDEKLRILETNPQAAELLEPAEFIDQALANATDKQLWSNWTQQLNSAILSGKACSFDNVSYTRNNNVRLLNIICTPLHNADTQTILGGAIIIEDITEKTAVERQLAGNERLTAMGKLASRVVHELNNPIDGILRYINLTKRIVEQHKLDKPAVYLQQCRKALMRMMQITSELLEFSRSTYSSLECAGIDEIIEEAIKTMEPRAAASNIRILRKYDSTLPKIRNSNLFQVFCNLIKNAIDAMAGGGKLMISTFPAANHTAAIEFRDTGPGFPPENTEAIFEPFFTTKDKAKGTGLGLAISKDIVEKYNGRITAENAPDLGSIFTVYIPLANNNFIRKQRKSQ